MKTSDKTAGDGRITDALLACPETVTVSVSGTERPFLLSVYGLELAAAQGHDPVPALVAAVADLFGSAHVDLDAVRENPEQAASLLSRSVSGVSAGTIGALADAVWAGLLPFDRTLDRDVFRATLSVPSLAVVLAQALKPMLALVSGMSGAAGTADAPDEDGPDEGAPGKPIR